jgi:hypothetical protein
MRATSTYRLSRPVLPAWVFTVFLIGAAGALAGGYWDDAWHTERGRDSFFIAPHLAIYSGVSLVGAVLALWTGAVVRREGVAAIRRQPALALALLGVAVTLGSAQIDNAWHVAFGRDAVIWSPPHMLGIAGMMALAAAVLLQLRADSSRRASVMRAIAGGLVIAAANFTVVEYETDVPQFPEVWFLPALVLSAAIAFAVIRLADPDRWALTRAALVHLGFILAVAAFLTTQSFDAPRLPLLVAPALALDLAASRRVRAPIAALVFVIVSLAAYAPVREIPAGDVAAGFPLSLVAGLVVLAGRRPRRALVATVGTAALLAAVPGIALAHDPGQGPAAGTVGWRVAVTGRHVSADVVVPGGGSCAAIQPGDLVARRAGEVIRTPQGRHGCRLHGQLQVPQRGRWFVYTELRRDRQQIESWVPVKVQGAHGAVRVAHRFAYRPDREGATLPKYVAGALLYAAMLGLVVTMLSLARRAI